MIFKRKVVRTERGVELRLSFLFEHEEVNGVNLIKDDPNVSIEGLRYGLDEDQRVDHYLTYLRIFCHWVRMWRDKDKYPDIIQNSVGRRKYAESRTTRKRRKRK